MDEISAWLTLSRAPSFHSSHLAALLEKLESVTAVVTASAAALRELGAPASFIEWLLSAQRTALVDRDRRWLDHELHHYIPWGTPDYPRLLTELTDAPVGLFVRGSVEALSTAQLAVVGSRNPTPTGREIAREIAKQLSRCGLTITSGLAVGIDAASHQSALDVDGITIAVCGTGLDVAYPKANAALADCIAAHGALVSEFPPGTPPLKDHFPRRNRIISGLSMGTLVVEAALRSGSLITARLAAEQGREVFAIPGSILNPLTRGCHRLIREGAKLVESVEDILAELRPLAGLLLVDGPQRKVFDEPAIQGPVLDKGYEILLDALGFEPAGVDLLVERTGLRADEVASMLLMLEIDGHIESCPGGLYVRTRKAMK
jgi:DNA processing protein